MVRNTLDSMTESASVQGTPRQGLIGSTVGFFIGFAAVSLFGPTVAYLQQATALSAEAATFWWTMGVNQSHQGVRTAQAMINLCVITGNIGRPGTGPNSITGQAKAMGSRLYSNTTSLYAGMDFLNDDHRQ